MKIAYLINQYPQTSQSFIRREITALEAAGIQVDRYTLRTWDQEVVDPADKAEKAKTRVVLGVGGMRLLLSMAKTAITRPGKFLNALRLAWKMGKRGERGKLYHLIYLAESCVLFKWLNESRAEHVHAHFGTNSTTVAMLVRALGGPGYSFTCHGPEEFDRPIALKLGDKIEHAEFAVAVSDFGRSQLFRWCGHAHWKKIHVIHCGVDSSFLTDDNTHPELPDVPRFVCVGRLAEQKGQLLLVEATARLKERNIYCEIVLVGDGPMRSEIERQISVWGLQDRVKITGWMSNNQVRQQLLNARAMVLPSFAEGLPVVVMEALALRRPVISTYVAGIPELVVPGVCGYLVPAGSVELLADAMIIALNEDAANLREMGRAGALRVARAHNASTEAAALAALFRGMASPVTLRVEPDIAKPSVNLSGPDRSEISSPVKVGSEK